MNGTPENGAAPALQAEAERVKSDAIRNTTTLPSGAAKGKPLAWDSEIGPAWRRDSEQERRYQSALNSIPPPGTGCHPHLLAVANLGLLAGRSNAEVLRDIAAAIPAGKRQVSEREITETIAKARATGYGATRATRRPPARTFDGAAVRTAIAARADGAGEAELFDASPVKPPVDGADDAAVLLRALYRQDEHLFIGQRTDGGAECVLTVAEWLSKPDRLAAAPHIIPNPLSGQPGPKKDGDGETHRGDACVIAWRFATVEFDGLPREQQVAFWLALIGAGVPVAALIDSGGKSVHGWVRVNAADADEWEHLVEYELFTRRLVPLGVDAACKNEARLSRLPGHQRAETGRLQRLLYLGPQAGQDVSPADVLAAVDRLLPPPVVDDGLPPIVSAAAWLQEPQPPVESVIFDVLDMGCKAVVIGPSKSMKTWFILQLAVSSATGREFLCWRVHPRKTLLVNLEVAPVYFHRRLQQVKSALGLNPADLASLDILNARGHDMALNGRADILPALLDRIRKGGYEVVILDPFYKLAVGDENKAEDVKPVLLAFDRICTETGAAVVYVHHDAKGIPGERAKQDRGAGSNVIQRDMDSAIYLTPHAQEGLLVVSTLLRNHPPQDDFTVAWDGCLRLSKVAPSVRTGRPRRQISDEQTAAVFKDKPLTKGASIAALQGIGHSRASAAAALDAAVKAGRLASFSPHTFPATVLFGTPEAIAAEKAKHEPTA